MDFNQQLKEIFDLDVNWDGYGALPIAHLTQKNTTIALVVFMRNEIAPEITPNPNGTISFEWISKNGTAHLEVGKSRDIAVVRPKGFPDIPQAGEGPGCAIDGNQVQKFTGEIEFLAVAIRASLFPESTRSVSITPAKYYLSHAR